MKVEGEIRELIISICRIFEEQDFTTKVHLGLNISITCTPSPEVEDYEILLAPPNTIIVFTLTPTTVIPSSIVRFHNYKLRKIINRVKQETIDRNISITLTYKDKVTIIIDYHNKRINVKVEKEQK